MRRNPVMEVYKQARKLQETAVSRKQDVALDRPLTRLEQRAVEIAARRGPAELNYFMSTDTWGESGIKFSYRDLPRHGEVDDWVHVFNEVPYEALRQPDYFPKWLANVMRITGEICASRLGDDLLARHDRLIAVVLRGPAEAVYDEDVYSERDVFGRRVLGSTTGNEHRTETWVVPAKCELVGVITDIDAIEAALHRASIPVIWLSKRGLAPGGPTLGRLLEGDTNLLTAPRVVRRRGYEYTPEEQEVDRRHAEFRRYKYAMSRLQGAIARRDELWSDFSRVCRRLEGFLGASIAEALESIDPWEKILGYDALRWWTWLQSLHEKVLSGLRRCGATTFESVKAARAELAGWSMVELTSYFESWLHRIAQDVNAVTLALYAYRAAVDLLLSGRPVTWS